MIFKPKCRNNMGTFGDSIQYYDVYELLGTGGFATVHRARCKKTGIDVAVKKIERKRIKAAGLANRVNQEVAIHSRLKHPSILQLLTFFEDDVYVYLVLELCHNGELQRYFKKTQSVLSESEACSIMKQVVQGLLYLHSHQIIHRDITLANLLLTKDMHIKIADFGLATQLQRPDEKHMTMCGTPNYISPEVATRASHGLETDVWGLGIMLYTCLVGRPPFDTDDGLKSTLTLVVMSDIKFPVYVSSEAQDLIKSLLQKNPKDRIYLKQILEHPFIRKSQSNSINGAMQRCASYDSGVATASYLTSQPYNSYSVGTFPSASKSGSFQNHCPPSSNSRKFPHTSPVLYDENTGCAISRPYGSISEGYSVCSKVSDHVCPTSKTFAPSQSGYESETPRSIVPTRCVPFQPHQSNQCSVASKHSGIRLEGGCSHNWSQCKQCSHIDSCGCLNTQPSCYSMGPKFRDNPVSSKLGSGCQPSRNSTKDDRHWGADGNRENFSLHNTPTQIPVPPLCSKRLRPVRQKTKNVIVSVLSTGDVCLEFIKPGDGHERVWEVMRISTDGMRIILYQPRKGKGVVASESPPPPPTTGADAIYNYENIPEKLWKKYSYAYKFVDLVKSKTPKITYYSPKAKCFLMENSPAPDFECCFYKGGKITKSQSRTTVFEASGGSFTFDFYDETPSFTTEVQFMWEHFRKCLDHCLTLNNTITELSQSSTSGESFFPVIIGRRPQ